MIIRVICICWIKVLHCKSITSELFLEYICLIIKLSLCQRNGHLLSCLFYYYSTSLDVLKICHIHKNTQLTTTLKRIQSWPFTIKEWSRFCKLRENTGNREEKQEWKYIFVILHFLLVKIMSTVWSYMLSEYPMGCKLNTL